MNELQEFERLFAECPKVSLCFVSFCLTKHVLVQSAWVPAFGSLWLSSSSRLFMHLSSQSWTSVFHRAGTNTVYWALWLRDSTGHITMKIKWTYDNATSDVVFNLLTITSKVIQMDSIWYGFYNLIWVYCFQLLKKLKLTVTEKMIDRWERKCQASPRVHCKGHLC